MPLPPHVLEERKTALIAGLSEQYAENRFSLEEYERLVEYTHKIETSREIALLGNLIRLNGAAGDGAFSSEGPGASRAAFSRSGVSGFAILASRKINGLAASGGDFLAILGDCQVYVNDSDLIHDETVINANALLGEVVIHVPDSVAVINNVLPILGDVGIKHKKRKKAAAEPPPWKKLVITGTAILGQITVKYDVS
ncbi:MAG: cell wall-active antibiotics response protein [Spirochaetaceae bacterium]|jgi:hypothetical protein|nr:cell wall-active antibiotics response protein [Spirochaetaceae bacterium]